VLSTTRQRSDGTAYLIGTATRLPTPGTYRATAAAASGAAAMAGPATTTVWVRTFRDEFSGSALDLGKWSYRVGTSPSRTKAVNSPRAVAVGRGRLEMSVKRKPGSSKLLNAQISTQPRSATQGHLQRYGVFSARIRYPEHRGQHGSFWMQSPTYGRYPGSAARSGAEIDVSEFFGRNYPDGGLGTFVYYANKSRANVKIGDVWRRAASLAPKGDRWWNAYHVFSLRWTPNRYLFYVDGRLLFTTTRGVSRTQEYLILSLLTSDWELPQLDRSKLPTHMDVDWTTAWQSAG
jgi:beta-glucanase (GH16 family)